MLFVIGVSVGECHPSFLICMVNVDHGLQKLGMVEVIVESLESAHALLLKEIEKDGDLVGYESETLGGCNIL